MVAAQWRAPLIVPASSAAVLKLAETIGCTCMLLYHENMSLLVEHVVNETPRPPSSTYVRHAVCAVTHSL